MVKWVAGEEPREKGARRKEKEKTDESVPSPCSSGLRLRLASWIAAPSFLGLAMTMDGVK
jgi:hypothetical protein